LGGVVVGLAADVRGRAADELHAVSQLLHAGHPPVEQFPLGGHVDHVFHKNDLVSVDLGGADNVHEGGSRALVSGLFDVAVFLQLQLHLLALVAAAFASGRAHLGTDR
jgi:hypothetical protein